MRTQACRRLRSQDVLISVYLRTACGQERCKLLSSMKSTFGRFRLAPPDSRTPSCTGRARRRAVLRRQQIVLRQCAARAVAATEDDKAELQQKFEEVEVRGNVTLCRHLSCIIPVCAAEARPALGVLCVRAMPTAALHCICFTITHLVHVWSIMTKS